MEHVNGKLTYAPSEHRRLVFLLCKLPQPDLHAAVILKGAIYVNHLPGVGSSSYIYLYSM